MVGNISPPRSKRPYITSVDERISQTNRREGPLELLGLQWLPQRSGGTGYILWHPILLFILFVVTITNFNSGGTFGSSLALMKSEIQLNLVSGVRICLFLGHLWLLCYHRCQLWRLHAQSRFTVEPSLLLTGWQRTKRFYSSLLISHCLLTLLHFRWGTLRAKLRVDVLINLTPH